MFCCIGPDYFAADAAALDPSCVRTFVISVFVGRPLDEFVGPAEFLLILLLFPLPVDIGDLSRHMLDDSRSPDPAVISNMEYH